LRCGSGITRTAPNRPFLGKNFLHAEVLLKTKHPNNLDTFNKGTQELKAHPAGSRASAASRHDVLKAKRRTFIVRDDLSNHVSVFMLPSSECSLLGVSKFLPPVSSPGSPIPPAPAHTAAHVPVLRAFLETPQRLPCLFELPVVRWLHAAL